MVVCADTSFLFPLYGNDANTPRVIAELRGRQVPIVVSSFGEYELGNALRFAEFRKVIRPGDASLCWAEFQADCSAGRVHVTVCNLADVLDEAKRLSSVYTLQGGHRGFDIIHVASALVLGADEFWTFDRNQQKLAEAEGLATLA